MVEKIIIHYGNSAGLPYRYACSLRQIGIDSYSIMPSEENYPIGENEKLKRDLPTDELLIKKNDNKCIKITKKISLIAKLLKDSSLIHFHGTHSILREIDIKLFYYRKIPMIISFAGGDARIEEIAAKKNPYFYRKPWKERDKKNIEKFKRISKYIKYVATDYELAEHVIPYFEKVFILRQAVDLTKITCRFPNSGTNIPVVVHIPTEPWAKGTEFINSAIKRLRNEGYIFEFRLLKNISQIEVYKEISQTDIYIDELRCGAHGVTAVEAMASGKPTITFIRDDLIEKYPKDLPIVNANPDTIYDKLKILIKDAELRHEIGIKSRKYVEKYHSLEVIGPKLLEIYREIGLKL